MRQNPDMEGLLAVSHPVACIVDVWYGGVLILSAVPLIEGSVSFDDSATLQRTCELIIPAYADAARYDPGDDPLGPLNCYGQRLHIRSGMVLPNGTTTYVDLGWYLTYAWERSEPDATITVKGADLALLIADDKLLVASAPLGNGTLASEATRLVNSILPVRIDPGLVDRAIPYGAPLYERERTDAIDGLCAAWPARWYVNDNAEVQYAPPYAPVTAATPPDVVITDGAAGSILGRARDGDRGRQNNIAVVEGITPDDGTAPPRAVAQITDPASPLRVGGPFGRRPRFFSSPFIATVPEAQAAADAYLDRWTVPGRGEVVSAAPDPRVQLGDVARVYTRDGDTFLGRVTKVDLPLTPSDGMQLTVSTVAEDDATVARRHRRKT
jgi:hypothetical protein